MTHPSETQLALFAGNDLPRFEQWRVRRHLRACGRCAGEVDAYAKTVLASRAASDELPPELNWDRLADEMTANIHLGMAAGECVAAVPKVRPSVFAGWRAAAVMSGMSVVLIAAWWLNPPRPHGPQLRGPEVEIRATGNGLELKGNGTALVLLNGRGGGTPRPIIVSSPGTLRARYVDTDSGQITINNVYSE